MGASAYVVNLGEIISMAITAVTMMTTARVIYMMAGPM